ncbi:hypothetical protein AN958_10493 [Leucoagaricus sp. SymC.cos]|nr:hypothetical protein AN958_10493 [Leucoagaricus sp. SymC.cos]
MCSWIWMPPNTVYEALRELHSALDVPLPQDAAREDIDIRHKSFSDFLRDPKMSGMLLGIKQEAKNVFFKQAI